MSLSLKLSQQTRALDSSLLVPYPVREFSGSIKPLLSLWTLLCRRQPITTAAMTNPTKAVMPKVIPTAVPASILSAVPWEDFCLFCVVVLATFMPIIPGPSVLDTAANSATELSEKKKFQERHLWILKYLFGGEKPSHTSKRKRPLTVQNCCLWSQVPSLFLRIVPWSVCRFFFSENLKSNMYERGEGGERWVLWFEFHLSRSRFKQSKISMHITHIYVLGCFENVLVIFG